jgi:hypothetical protein
MANREKLLAKAKSSPSNLRFSEVCKLAECYGWVFERKESSHSVFLNPILQNLPGFMMNFQEHKGNAKAYQVRQLLTAIELMEEIDDEATKNSR